MRMLSLRDLIVQFDTQLQQLTLNNLIHGAFPYYSAVVAFASVIVCCSLAMATRISATASTAAAPPPPLLFSSFTAFAATCLAALMATTLVYRLTGGRFSSSPRSTGYVVDWIMDAVSRPLADDTAAVLLMPEKRRARGCFFLAICVVGEIGKYLSFWSMCTLVSLAWCGWSLARLHRAHVSSL